MKLIHKFKSLNYDNRVGKKVSYIILHYTALPSVEKSIDFLCKAENKVSCHYIISQSGKIYNLVNEKKRAWHAGQSYWLEEKDLNSISIGIELDFSPNHNNNKFSNLLIDSLIQLLRNIKKKYKIDRNNILAHSDIAPYRKIDPGEKFPWNKLYNLNLSFNPIKIKTGDLKKMKNWFKKNKIYKNEKKILIMLNIIGYDISKSIKNKYYYGVLLKNYRNRFLQKVNFDNSDLKLINFIELHTYNLLLTKL